MEKLLNVENNWDGDVNCEMIEGPCCLITHEEVKKAINGTKIKKAAGPSGVVTEMLQAAGNTGVEWITNICNDLIAEGDIPPDWKNSTLVPVYKGKGDDALECSSYRAIKLLEQPMKVIERVLERRVRAQACIDDMQLGFMPRKDTTDAIFIVREMQEKHLAKKKKLHFAFVDLEKAIDWCQGK